MGHNRLKDEKSLYLKQHIENPVHWWPYSPDAIQRATDENKPIFLSVGYSACHWCHVMAHESFSDEITADILNEHFISIKVDREEYPDIDNYYQLASHLFNQQGGWPLSAFLLPDMKPFFVGTYFPKTPKENEATFTDVLNEVLTIFHEKREQAYDNASKVTDAISEGLIPKDKVDFQGHFPGPISIMDAIEQFKDNENGGFGDAPKFPNFSFYEWAIEQMLEGMINQEHGQHIINSMDKMLMGGISDHARGGIHRYSTDKKWIVPHFEKMLYDQAGFLKVLTKLSLLYPSPIVYDSIINTLDYLSSEMFDEENKFFFSAQSADSEGVEGLYFTFSEDEFEETIKNSQENINDELDKEIDKIKKWFNITKSGNFFSALNIIFLNNSLKDEIFTPKGWELVRKVRKSIVEARKDRVPPQTDNKGVASWNFSLMSALMDVMQYTKIDSIRNMATNLFNQSFEGIYNNFLVSKDGAKMKIRHTTTLNDSLPYLEDYTTFAEMQMRSYELTGNSTFKENFFDTLQYIQNEFIEDGVVYTRAVNTNDHALYPNQEVNAFDNSFKSPLSTLINITRRAKILFSDNDIIDSFSEIYESTINQALKNPLNSGEALRAFTYPDEAYKVVKVPKKWLSNDKFVNFLPYFLNRFIFDYHEDGDSWQICSASQCELQGSNLDDFMEALTPPKEESENGPES